MTGFEMYIHSQLAVIEKECMAKGLSASEWIERHADEYWKIHGDKVIEDGYLGKDENRRARG